MTYRNDEQKQVQVIKANIVRDSRGRIRIERFYDGTAAPPENVPMDITIDDDCGTSVILLPSQRTAKVSKMPAPARISDQPCCQEADLRNPPYTEPEGKFESLGHKLVDGAEVRGERTTFYVSVEARSFGAAPIRVYEEWCSTLLDTPMGSYILDEKPKREITTVITNVKEIEPDPALFEIPKEYRIVRVEPSAPVSNPSHSERTSSPD